LDTPTVDRSSDDRTAPAVPLASGAAADGAPVSAKAVDSDQATSFINAVARVEPELAEILRQCEVTVTDNVRIVAPVGVRPGVESAMNLLRSTAGRAGLGVELA
jgi:F0F1-type ATP synthase delta subunit